jgi:predicted metal-dependent HD superfamily phosphohydrolase
MDRYRFAGLWGRFGDSDEGDDVAAELAVRSVEPRRRYHRDMHVIACLYTYEKV